MEILIDSEFKNLIPPLTAEEYAGLEESILKDGCRDALVLWGNILIDGHNRYEICQKHGLPFDTMQKDFRDRNSAIVWMVQNQLARRNLPAYERARLALRLKPAVAKKAKENQATYYGNQYESGLCQKSDEVQNVDTKKIIATAAGVSHDTLAKVEKLEQAAPDSLKQQLRSGDISINQAYKQVKKAEAKQEKAARKTYPLPEDMPDNLCRLFTADIRDGLPMIADESIDFIITDPPYPKEYLPLFGDLSKLAARVLKPGGSLIVMSGQSYLPEVITQLGTAMHYHWCMTYLTPGGQAAQMWDRRINTFWKPVLWYVKGKYDSDWAGDVLKSPVNANEKEYHEWGQSVGGMRDIVEKLTNPGNIILDPFLGGGTTGVAAVLTGRKFIGADINSENIEKSDRRIKETYANTRCKG